METLLATLVGGFLLGLASSAHCACMCGGIASGALFLAQPRTQKERMVSLLLIQGGRIATYAIAGGAVASLASIAIDPGATQLSYRIVQWVGALALMWVGFATAGLLPRAALPVPGSPVLSGFIDRVQAPLRRHGLLGPFAIGLSWGLTPCPMVYAALLSAALTGSLAGGVLWMLAFGAGTLPGVLAAALGTSMLARMRRGPATEMAAGLLLAGFGFSTVYFDWSAVTPFCLGR